MNQTRNSKKKKKEINALPDTKTMLKDLEENHFSENIISAYFLKGSSDTFELRDRYRFLLHIKNTQVNNLKEMYEFIEKSFNEDTKNEVNDATIQ